jgi:hypothetical protein
VRSLTQTASAVQRKTENPAGSFALDALDLENVSAGAAVWEKALRKVRARSMWPRPDDAAYDSIASGTIDHTAAIESL